MSNTVEAAMAFLETERGRLISEGWQESSLEPRLNVLD